MKNLAIVTIIALAAVVIIPVLADSITTDQTSYKYGDTIQVSASFTHTATIKILNPNGDVVYVIQVKPSQDAFEKNVLIMGPLWNQNGTYDVQMMSGGIQSDSYFGVNAPLEAKAAINPVFSFSNSTQAVELPPPTLSFSDSNATNPVTMTDVQEAKKIPSWVRSIFIAYGEQEISESELVEAIKFLISNNIIQLS